MVLRDQLLALARRRRRELGWTQRQLALAVGSSASRMSKLESGDQTVSLDLIVRVLDAMEAGVDVLLDPSRDPLADPALSPAQKQLLARALWRRRAADVLAARAGVDPGDVARALFNLEKTPEERLRSSFRRAKLRRQPAH